MPIGRRGMGIVGVAATAKVVSNRAVERNEAEHQAQDAAAQQAAAQQAAAQPAAATPAADDITAQLEKLASLHTAGVLSDEEFAAAKAKLLS